LLRVDLKSSQRISAGAIMDRPYTRKEKSRIIAGAVAALVVIGWVAVLGIAFLSAR